MANAITVAMISMIGERESVRRSWCIALRTVLTSVVPLVIRLGVEKRSMFEKEKL